MKNILSRAAVAVLLIAGAARAADLPLTIQGRSEHPTVYLTKADLARARANREKFPWAKKAADTLLKRADIWANKSDDELLSLVPKENACFAYGFSSCPLCDKQNSWWGATGCSFDDPGHVRCPGGHRMPDDAHPDPGTGWRDPAGKIYYFVGTYHSFVSEQLLLGLNDLSHAFALTGDNKYGAKAAFLLDQLARVYPTCDKGSWDYPSNPPSGRFNRPWYQVARTLIQYTDDYDILMSSELLNAPSSVSGLTRRQNIEQNLILNGAKYCYDQSLAHPSLTNGQCDYIRGCLVAGVALGIPEYVRWGVDGPTSIRNMVDNNIDRDGQYYETSSGYSHHTRYLYLDSADILNHYADANYPDGVHLAQNPKLRAFCLLPNSRTQVAGLQPTLGDDAPNLKPGTSSLPNPEDISYLRHLYALCTTDAERQDLAPLMPPITENDKDIEWLLFHHDPSFQSEIRNPKSAMVHPLTNAPLGASDLLPQRGLAILRSRTGAALTLRAGPTLNHGHFDELNLNLFAFRQDLTYDIGYGLASTHTQVGWAKQTASHNTVFIDEKPQLAAPSAGGCVTEFVSTDTFQLATADDPNAYASQSVTKYQRTLALIDASDQDAYAIDLFRVAGGKQHDYVFHARSESLTTSWPTGSPRAGSLAGETINHTDLLSPDGDLRTTPNKPYFNPPPGNGLGFLIHPTSAKAAPGPNSATWTLDDSTHLRLHAISPSDTTFVTAIGPGILPGKYPRAAYLYARHAAPSSTFASVLEPYQSSPVIKDVESLLPPPTDATSPVSLKITLATGRTDYFSQGPTGTSLLSILPDHSTTITLAACSSFNHDNVTISMPASLTGTLSRIDYDRRILYTSTSLPAGTALANSFITLSNPAYTRPTTYRIASVTPDGDGCAIHLAPTTLVLARPFVQSAPKNSTTLPNIIPLEYAKSVRHKPTGFFDGKLITTAGGKASTTIRSVDGSAGTTITVDDASNFPANTPLLIYDLRVGDTFAIPMHAVIHITPDGRVTTESPVPVKVTW